MPNTKIDVEPASRQLSRLRDDVDDLLARLSTAESLWSWWLAGVATQNRSSARNMLHYWAIRQRDLRDLQARLAVYGLSSLGRSEPHVEATLHLVRSAICYHVGKGEELGCFQFGGSTHCLVFRPGAIADFTLAALPQPHNPDAPQVLVRSKLAIANTTA